MSGSAPSKGLFITFEGGEGVGKSTQIAKLNSRLRDQKIPVVSTREPGGTPGAEAIREVLLSGSVESLGPEVEALLFAAARLDHVQSVIEPALKAGKVVLCDRFIDSTRAYQGNSGKVSDETLSMLENLIRQRAWPDVTYILDIDPKLGFERIRERNGTDDSPDRFEKEDLKEQRSRRDAFLSIAIEEPERCAVIAADRRIDEIHEEIWQHLSMKLDISNVEKDQKK